MQTRSFDLGDVLSVVTGKVVGRKGDEGVRLLLAFMVGNPALEPPLRRELAACRLEILRQHPSLVTVSLPMRRNDESVIRSWLSAQVAVFGAELSIRQLPPGGMANQQRPRGGK